MIKCWIICFVFYNISMFKHSNNFKARLLDLFENLFPNLTRKKLKSQKEKKLADQPNFVFHYSQNFFVIYARNNIFIHLISPYNPMPVIFCRSNLYNHIVICPKVFCQFSYYFIYAYQLLYIYTLVVTVLISPEYSEKLFLEQFGLFTLYSLPYLHTFLV